VIASALTTSAPHWLRVGTGAGVRRSALWTAERGTRGWRVPPVAIYARVAATVDGHPSDRGETLPLVVVEHRLGATGTIRRGRFVSVEAAVEFLQMEFEGGVWEVLDPLDDFLSGLGLIQRGG